MTYKFRLANEYRKHCSRRRHHIISGYDRVIDLRAALLDPASGDLLNPGSTTQISRYPIRAGADHIVVARPVWAAPDPRAAARAILADLAAA